MKNFNKIISLAGLILFLTACASTPDVETHYFLLNPSQSSATNTAISSDTINLEPIQLAKFLDQPGIVLQTAQHEIKVAHYYRWAEPLKKNLHRYIYHSLGIRNSSDASQSLEIHIQQFHGTQDGSALVSGYWTINNESHPFSYHAPLTKTGYAELVAQLALLLDQLCVDIASQINV